MFLNKRGRTDSVFHVSDPASAPVQRVRVARGVTALNCVAFASFHGVSVYGQDQGTDTLSRSIAGKRGGACVSLLLGSAGPTFTHQMHPLHLYLEADRGPQAQHGQNCTCGRLSPTQPASARVPPLRARPQAQVSPQTPGHPSRPRPPHHHTQPLLRPAHLSS